MDAQYNEMDANLFNQYMYKSNDENLDVSLSVPQYNNNGQQQQQSVNQTYHEMNDQTFHTPSFGDEEFDIPVMHHQQPASQHHQLDQYQHLHGHQMGLLDGQQQVGVAPYNQHQWHHQQTATESHMMANQTYQLSNQSNYHHMSSPNQQMLMMQPPNPLQPQTQHQLQSHPPQISPQLNAGGNNYIGQSPSQTILNNENGSTSDESDDNALNDPNNAFKRPSPDPFTGGDSPKGSGAKKAKPAVRKATKKKKDPNEPQKPVSAYALFFRDTQAAIKGQNPNASFGEVSKIVASMWDVLAPEHKNVYKKKTETAKKDYLKALAAYRASLVSQGTEESQSPPHQQQLASPTQNIPQAPQISMQNLQQQNPQAASPHQMQPYPQMSQTYQQSFVNQSIINQNMMQPQNTMMNVPQHGTQSQYMNQQLHQMNQPVQQQKSPQNIQPQQINNGNNNSVQLPPSGNSNNIAATQNCIRNGCTNAAIVSNDWEDEYCSNECVVTHCRDVFGNWVQNQSAAQKQQTGC